jgi:hypothetical protein
MITMRGTAGAQCKRRSQAPPRRGLLRRNRKCKISSSLLKKSSQPASRSLVSLASERKLTEGSDLERRVLKPILDQRLVTVSEHPARQGTLFRSKIWRFGMKARIAGWLAISALSVGLIFVLAGFALNKSSSSTITTAPPISSNTTAPFDPGMTRITSTTATEGSGSWKQSATDAFHGAEVATKSEYNQVARNIKDIWLEAQIKIVLHENKSTRDSNVRVTADDGIVTLTGQVPSEQNARRAQDIVASIYGVRVVKNALNYPHDAEAVTPSDAVSTGLALPAYSDTAPAEDVPDR